MSIQINREIRVIMAADTIEGGKMNRKFKAIIATSTLITIMAITGLAGLKSKMTVEIPFSFSVNGKTLPAGTYAVKQGGATGVITIANWEEKLSISTITTSVTTRDRKQPRLIFRRYGDQVFLARAYDGFGNGVALYKTKAEREAANKDHLAMNSEPEIVTLVARAGQ